MPGLRSAPLLALAALAAAARPLPQDTLAARARAALSQLDGTVRLAGLRDSVVVVRDRWGVPHIRAQNVDDLFFAQGFVQAQDRLWQMEMYRRTYEGRLAELLGPAFVAHDRLVRLLNDGRRWDDAEYAHYHPLGRRLFDAFAAGVNAYITHAGDRLPVEFTLTGIRPRPWTADIALLRTQTAMPIADARADLLLALRAARLGATEANRRARPSPWRDLVVPAGLDLAAIDSGAVVALGALYTGPVRPPLLPPFARLAGATPGTPRAAPDEPPGSNNWVVSGRLTASGRVLLANDPHRAVSVPSIRYLVHLTAPGWDLAGATEPVLPGVMIGHNGRIAWGLTIVGIDQADVFVERVDPARPDRVRRPGGWEPLRRVVDTIAVKDAPAVVVTHEYSTHGPIFWRDTVRHLAYALRSTAAERGTAGYLTALRYHALDDCAAFLRAQRDYHAPSENMICGDVHGNIAWQASGLAPRRVGWDGRLPVPGDGPYRWDGFRDDHPREFNPARGWIATANHDIHPLGFDPPLFFKQGPQRDRYDRIAQVLSAGTAFTPADFAALQHDAYNPAGARDAALFRGWQAADPDVEAARVTLAAWDGQHRRDARGAAWYRFVGPAIPDAARDPARPARERQALLEQVLRAARDSLTRTLGPDPTTWRWGRFNTTALPHPVVGAYDLPSVERHGGAGFVAAVGATFRQIIDLGDLDGSLVTNLPGQSGQPGSPFYGDAIERFGRGEYFPLVYTAPAVRAAARHILVLRPR